MFPYAEESFTEAESEILRRYFTNLDGPVFALVNLPEVVKGALFARYSRSAKSLRRLFLDEFVGDLDLSGDITLDATVGVKRAEELYERVFLEYGDDSVAQLGGVHLACEQASNLVTKVLERGRLMAYLEQSTRYISYNSRLATGHYRYYRDPDVLDSQLGARYVGDMDRMFDTYAELLSPMQARIGELFPQGPGDSDFAYRQAVRAKALDALRGLLPAASLSNLGIYGTGQAYEALLMRMKASPLPESGRYATLMLEELRKVIPSFLQRVDRPDRGGEWISYLESTRRDTQEVLNRIWPEHDSEHVDAPHVRLVDFDPAGEDKVLAAICQPLGATSEEQTLEKVRALGSEDKLALFKAYVGDRRNRRHRPGRAFERTDYRFEIVSDYGAFRDLQRHRMLTVEWQQLGTELGYDVPELVTQVGMAEQYVASMERSADLFTDMRAEFPEQSQYAVALAYRIRYTMQMNAREAMHVLELRSGPQGHPTYRTVAQQMHELIAEQAGHRLLADAMVFVDHGSADLERLDAEERAEKRRASRSPA